MTTNTSASNNAESPRASKRDELLTFLFLVLALAPLLSVALIGGYGLLVWLFE